MSNTADVMETFLLDRLITCHGFEEGITASSSPLLTFKNHVIQKTPASSSPLLTFKNHVIQKTTASSSPLLTFKNQVIQKTIASSSPILTFKNQVIYRKQLYLQVLC